MNWIERVKNFDNLVGVGHVLTLQHLVCYAKISGEKYICYDIAPSHNNITFITHIEPVHIEPEMFEAMLKVFLCKLHIYANDMDFVKRAAVEVASSIVEEAIEVARMCVRSSQRQNM